MRLIEKEEKGRAHTYHPDEVNNITWHVKHHLMQAEESTHNLREELLRVFGDCWRA